MQCHVILDRVITVNMIKVHQYDHWISTGIQPHRRLMVPLLPLITVPDSKVRGTNMGPIWGRQDPGGPHVGPMKFAIWEVAYQWYSWHHWKRKIVSLTTYGATRDDKVVNLTIFVFSDVHGITWNMYMGSLWLYYKCLVESCSPFNPYSVGLLHWHGAITKLSRTSIH